MHGFVTNLAQA